MIYYVKCPVCGLGYTTGPGVLCPHCHPQPQSIIQPVVADDIVRLAIERDTEHARADKAEALIGALQEVKAEEMGEMERRIGWWKKRWEEAEADRDEWKQQHENLLGVRDTDLRALTARILKAEAALADSRREVERLWACVNQFNSKLAMMAWNVPGFSVPIAAHDLPALEAALGIGPTPAPNPIEASCDEIGLCRAPAGASGVTNCTCCGKELEQRTDGQWYTWDAPDDARPQSQEPAPTPEPDCPNCPEIRVCDGPADCTHVDAPSKPPCPKCGDTGRVPCQFDDGDDCQHPAANDVDSVCCPEGKIINLDKGKFCTVPCDACGGKKP